MSPLYVVDKLQFFNTYMFYYHSSDIYIYIYIYISDDTSIFKMAAICHLTFLQSAILVMWHMSECDSTSTYRLPALCYCATFGPL